MTGLSEADRAAARSVGTAARALTLGPEITAKLSAILGPPLREAIASETMQQPASGAA